MKPKIKAVLKGAALGAAFIAVAVILGSCTTTTTTLPDGSTTTIRSTDPVAAATLSALLMDAANVAKARIVYEK